MILKHPLSTTNEANKKAIEKYKDRRIYLYHGLNQRWYGGETNGVTIWTLKPNRIHLSFKEALKLTKTFPKTSNIEYHFLSDIGEETPSILDFEPDEIFLCPTVTFDSYKKQNILE